LIAILIIKIKNYRRRTFKFKFWDQLEVGHWD